MLWGFSPPPWVSYFSWDFCWALEWTRVSRSSSSLLISYNNDNNAINVWKPTWLLSDCWHVLQCEFFASATISDLFQTTVVQSLLVLPPSSMYFTILVFPNCVLVGSRVDILVRKYWSYFGGGKFQHSGPQCLPPQRVTGFTNPQCALGRRKREERPQVKGSEPLGSHAVPENLRFLGRLWYG